jgi:hypothetical protein
MTQGKITKPIVLESCTRFLKIKMKVTNLPLHRPDLFLLFVIKSAHWKIGLVNVYGHEVMWVSYFQYIHISYNKNNNDLDENTYREILKLAFVFSQSRSHDLIKESRFTFFVIFRLTWIKTRTITSQFLTFDAP